ncbi:hypothetical protein BBD46_02945 [Natrialba sp. SSL1]|nr:hypothetical protein BBD46_02945 [Natrialba sp. SSL1]
MLLDLSTVSHIMVDGQDDRWRPTSIAVHFGSDHGTGTDEPITLMQRGGWGPMHVCFSRHQITFEEVDS